MLNSPQRLNHTKEILGVNEVHLEPAKGNKKQNIEYCSKSESKVWGPVIIGDVSQGQGVAKPTKAVAQMVVDGISDKEIAMEYPDIYMMRHKGIQALRSAVTDIPNFRFVRVIWHWGDTGMGKTRRAYTLAPDLYVPLQGNNRLWFDNYDRQGTILLDELSHETVKLEYLLRLLDGYSLQVDVKGGAAWARWDRVFITSNLPPECTYPDAPIQQQRALSRRVHEIFHFTPDHVRAQRVWYCEDVMPPTEWPQLNYNQQCQLPF